MEIGITITTTRRLGKSPIASFEGLDQEVIDILNNQKKDIINQCEDAVFAGNPIKPKEGVEYIIGIDAATDGSKSKFAVIDLTKKK